MKSDFSFLEICFRAVFPLGECEPHGIFLVLPLASCSQVVFAHLQSTLHSLRVPFILVLIVLFIPLLQVLLLGDCEVVFQSIDRVLKDTPATSNDMLTPGVILYLPRRVFLF